MSAEATTIFGYADFILRGVYGYTNKGVYGYTTRRAPVKCAQINLVNAEIKIILGCAYKEPVKQWLNLLYEILP